MDGESFKILMYLYDRWQIDSGSVCYAELSEITDLKFEMLCILLPELERSGYIRRNSSDYCYSLTFHSIWLMYQNELILKGF